MNHWDDVFQDKILRVNNEDVIDDLEGQVRRMLKYLRIPFEKSVFHFIKLKDRLERLARNRLDNQLIKKAREDGSHIQNIESRL